MLGLRPEHGERRLSFCCVERFWQLCSFERLSVSLHGVENSEKLSGDGDYADFLRSRSFGDGLKEALETGVCANGTEGGHVESFAHPAPSPL
ncbi:hypothetical protein, partial [Jiella mangrovi]|uniref:hypothetical protein n=1 Tax=Jiella mangrovi TaxID=2821407 RepID=UPI001FD8483C